MPAVRRWRALAVAVVTVGLVGASAWVAGPAMADSHGHGNGGSSASCDHRARGNGDGHGRPRAKNHPDPKQQESKHHDAAASSGDAIRHDLATATARRSSNEGPGRSARADRRGRGHSVQGDQRHGRHAAAKPRGAAKGQQPAVPNRPGATTPGIRPVSAIHPVIALRGRPAERTAIANHAVVVAQPPTVVGDGGSRVVPPLENLVLRVGDVARFSLFGGPVGWMLGGALVLAILLMSAAYALGRRRGASGTA